MVFGKSLSQRPETNRWRADGVRVEICPGFITLDILEELQKIMKDLQCEPEQSVQRQDHLHVNVQRHCMVRTRKYGKVCI